MLNKKLKEINDTKAKLASLEKQVAAARQSALGSLHTEYGFDSRADLVEALSELGGSGRGRPRGPKKGAKKKRAAKKGGGKKRAAKEVAAKTAPAKKARKGKRKRAKITPELRKAIIDSIKGGATGAAVAKEHGVSLPTVQNIKRDAGLTRK